MEPPEAVTQAIQRGLRAALIKVSGVEGNPPSREGLSLAVTEDGETFGSLGCDGFDSDGRRDGQAAIASGRRGSGRYRWDGNSAIQVEVVPYAPGDSPPAGAAAAELLVVGDGPVAKALVDMGATLGFRVVSATRKDRPPVTAGSLLIDSPDEILSLGIKESTYVVICGHDEEFSQPILRVLIDSPSPYLGMMGSSRHTGHLEKDLAGRGFPKERIERVHSPVGLDIGSETPEEIALSALAQIVSVRRGRGR